MKKLLSLLLLTVLLFSAALPCHAAEPSMANTESALLYCFHTDSTIFTHRADKPLPPGNTAQLMTVLLALEAYPDLDTAVTLTPDLLPGWYVEGDYRTPADYGFRKNASVSVRDLIAATVIENANCSTLLLASLIAGNKSDFTVKMNARAAELGMVNTVYQNPTGADSEGAYTTANDLMLLAKLLYTKPEFMALASAPSFTLASNGFTMYTRNYFIGKWYTSDYLYSRANGMKAGYTDKAGYTLVATATESDGYSYLAIVLGGKEIAFRNTAYATAKALFQWGASAFSYREVLSSATLITTIPVENGDGISRVSLFPKESVSAYLQKDIAKDELTVNYNLHTDSLQAPFDKGTAVGEVTVSYRGEVVATVPLVTGNAVTLSQNAALRDATKTALKWIGIALLILLGLVLLRYLLRILQKKLPHT